MRFLNKKAMRVFLPLGLCLILVAGGGIFLRVREIQTPAYQLSLGRKYLSELKYEEAILAFTKVIAVEPANVEAYFGMADAYAGLDDFVQMAATLERGYGLIQDERLVERLWNRGMKLLEEQQRYEEAAPLLETYVRLAPGRSSMAYSGLAEIYSHRGDFQSMRDILDTGYKAMEATGAEDWEAEGLYRRKYRLCRKAGIPPVNLTPELEEYFRQLMDAFAADDRSRIDQMVRGEEMQALGDILTAQRTRENELYYGNTYQGTGLAIQFSRFDSGRTDILWSVDILYANWEDWLPEGKAIYLRHVVHSSPSPDPVNYIYASLTKGLANGPVIKHVYWLEPGTDTAVAGSGSHEPYRVEGMAEDDYWVGDVLITGQTQSRVEHYSEEEKGSLNSVFGVGSSDGELKMIFRKMDAYVG